MKILVIKMRHLGDVLLTTPVFSHLQKAYPGAEIDAMIYADTAPMLEGHPSIRSLLCYDKAWKKGGWFAKMAKEISLLRRIRKEKYDLVINLTEGDRGAIVAFISKAKMRVGFDPEKKGFLGKRLIYTHLVKNCKMPRHTVEKNLDALRRIGIHPTPEERDLYFHLSAEDKARAKAFVGDGAFVLIHPASRWKFKCWPPGHVAKLIEKLHFDGKKVVLTASSDPQEIAMIDEIVALVPHIPVLNLAGKIRLKELGALIDLSEVLICVDSVPLHMASALKAPVVVLFGPSSPLNWGPWKNPRAEVVTLNLPCQPCFLDGCGGSKKSDCLLSLPVSRVLEALERLSEILTV
jgi:lipopolysaccharide heptosyltransferase III